MQNEELELKGKGVEPVKIPAVEAAAEIYISARDNFVIYTRKLQETQEALRDAMHANEKALKRSDGALVYRFDDQVITVTKGKEKIKIKAIDEDE